MTFPEANFLILMVPAFFNDRHIVSINGYPVSLSHVFIVPSRPYLIKITIKKNTKSISLSISSIIAITYIPISINTPNKPFRPISIIILSNIKKFHMIISHTMLILTRKFILCQFKIAILKQPI